MKKTHKRTKCSRMHGHGMGTHGTGCRKNRRKSGQSGGVGMAGSGKRADQKKTLVLKLYGNAYFGKQGITSKGTKRDTRQRINLKDLMLNVEKYGKKTKDGWDIAIPKYKILGDGEVKEKLNIKCLEASQSAIDKVKKAGGKIEILKKSEKVKEEIEEADEE